MKAGRLRHKLKIYTPDSTPDAYGSIGESFTLLRTVPASIVHRTFRERSEQGEKLSRVEFQITTRWRSGLQSLDPATELEIDGRRLRTLAVTDPKGDRRSLVIYAEEVR